MRPTPYRGRCTTAAAATALQPRAAPRHPARPAPLAGREAGASLVSHPLVDTIAFTGSTAAGRLIGAECGRLIRRMTLELGGTSAAVVLDDADMGTFLAGLDGASFMDNGQTCTTQSRILAPRSRYAEVVDALADYCKALVVGRLGVHHRRGAGHRPGRSG